MLLTHFFLDCVICSSLLIYFRYTSMLILWNKKKKKLTKIDIFPWFFIYKNNIHCLDVTVAVFGMYDIILRLQRSIKKQCISKTVNAFKIVGFILRLTDTKSPANHIPYCGFHMIKKKHINIKGFRSTPAWLWLCDLIWGGGDLWKPQAPLQQQTSSNVNIFMNWWKPPVLQMNSSGWEKHVSVNEPPQLES